MRVSAGPIERARVETVTGAVTVSSALRSDARLTIETHAGDVELRFPARTPVRLDADAAIALGEAGRQPGRAERLPSVPAAATQQDKEGKDQYTTEVIATEMQMLGSREGMGGGEERGGGDDYGDRPQQRSAPAARPAASKPAAKPATGFDAMDDDIPF